MQSPTSQIKSKGVQAGAGAGKTYNLTHTVVEFVNDFHIRHGRWPHVMVTTFTKKATQELSERLISLALEKDERLVDYMSSSAYLSVSTIDGILSQFLKQNGHLLGLNSDFTYFKKSEAQFQAKKLLKRLMESNDEMGGEFRALLKSYPFYQLYEFLMESLGTNLQGFRVLTAEDLRHLLTEKISDLRSRVTQMARELSQNSPLEGNWAKFLEVYQAIIPLLNVKDWDSHRPRILEILSGAKLSGMTGKKYAHLQHLYAELKVLDTHLWEIESPEYDSSTFEHIGKVQESFARLRTEFVKNFFELKRDLNKIEISDLTNWSYSLIQQFPEAAQSFANGKDFWLIDEFQDTNRLQVQILQALVGQKPTYVVGDPQQSIYLFRGARTEVFRDKLEEIRRSGGTEQVLDTNYRSTPEVLSLMNHLSQDMGFRSLKPDPRKALGAETLPAAHITLVCLADAKENGEHIENLKMAEHMMRLHSQGVGFEKMAVLMRKNDDLETVATELQKWHIPVLLHSSGFFWRRREVKDALCLLKFFINPRDDLNLAALLRMPYLAVSEQALADAAQAREKSFLWKGIEPQLRDGGFGETGRRLWEIYKDRETLGLRISFIRAMTSLGLLDFHLKYDPTGRAEGNLWKFTHLLRTFEMERGASFVQFINEAEFAATQEKSSELPGGEQPNKVNLMTVHASKGLEFDHVFLPYVGKKPKLTSHLDFAVDEANKIWAIRSPSGAEELKSVGTLFESSVVQGLQRRELEESDRVFYVAYTRAKKSLYLSWSEPIKPDSWASKISLDLSVGLHEGNDFSYRVEEATEAPVLQPLSLERAESAKARSPQLVQRHSYFEIHKEDHLSVTAALASNLKTHKSSFIKKRQGILFHRLLEVTQYAEGKDFKALIARWFPGEEDNALAALQFLRHNSEVPYNRLISEGEVEWPFVLQENGKMTSGQIDLWGIVNDELWVVDYKSGERILKEKAFEQLDKYAEALKEYLHWNKPIHRVVVYPFLETQFTERR